MTSLVIEGVFERFPRLKVVMIEGGFAWLPALAWRLDKLFERMRSEVPHLKKKPSEYIRQHIWVHRPSRWRSRRTIASTCSTPWSGSAGTGCCSPPTTRTGTSTTPSVRFPAGLPKERHKQILAGNGRAVYRLGIGLLGAGLSPESPTEL